MLLLARKVRFSRYTVHGSRLRQHSGHAKNIEADGKARACCHIADVRACPCSSFWHCAFKDVCSARISRPLQRRLPIHGLRKVRHWFSLMGTV